MERTVQLLVFAAVCIFASTLAKDTCPPPGLLHPCICEQDVILTSIRCSNITDMETLVSVFARSGDRRFKYFSLDHSSLLYLPARSLESKKFKGLLVAEVRLTSLFDQVPSVANEVEMLTLNKAFLQRGVRWELLQPLTKLTWLQLVKTDIKSLGKSFVKSIANKKIAYLMFSETKTSHLDDQVFADLKELTDLYVVKNQIKVLKRSMFARPAAIKNFIFSNNEIESLPENIFSDMPFLKSILLLNNRISKFTEATFGGIYDQLLILTIERNPIDCDCSIQWFISRSERGKVLGTCGNPQDKKDRRISDINKKDLDYCSQTPIHGANSLEAIFGE